MKHIFKHLRKSWKALAIIVVLLAVQAICDLSLPDYTSRIINVGVQQSGIENAAPTVLSKSTMEEFLLLTNDKDASVIKKSYKVLEYKTMTKTEKEKYEKKYPIIKEENVYLLKNISEKETEELSDILSRPMFARYMLTSDSKQSKQVQEQIKQNMPESMRNLDVMTILKSLPKEQVKQMQKETDKSFAKIPDSIISQSAISSIKEEYQKVGLDTEQMQSHYIIFAGLKMLAIALLSMICTIGVAFIGSKTAARLAQNLRNSVYEKVLSFSTTEFKQYGVASLITRTTNDIQQIQMLMVFALRIIFYAPIIGVGGVIKVLQTNTSMAWIIALAIAIILCIMLFMFFVAMPRFKKVQKLIDRLNLVTREILNGIPVVRAFSNQKHEEKRFDKANMDLKKNTLFVDRLMSLLMPTMMFVMNAICILIVWKGAHSVNDGVMQVGDMLAFIQYTMQIVMAFLMVSMFSIMLPRAGVSASRVSEVLNTKPVITEPKNPKTFSKRIKGLVEFKNVTFRYSDSDEDVLTDITFTAKQGETTAFIGSTGSGKSTLISLIPRLFDVTKGEILIDGVNIKEAATEDLHKKIGFVPQKGILFSGTIASNLRYGKKEATDEEMEKAASIAQATEFIASKKEGYEMPIAQGGTNVSGGQKQRLSIARAIATDPEIYIFDDSFSALDFKTDAALRKALKSETKEATVLIVAQRISTIMHADQIIVLDEGKIVGKGTHKELLKTCDVYTEIASSQLTKEELENE
ncbi:MAG: ABC transporter ATP-binding protein [Bacilli bacterium]|nr:ABC transporter ATP-binding protein [Bacilli bacterium]